LARRRRDLTRQVDIWPGFVDALSTLLMAVIFLLVVFVLTQFLMGRLLAGRNEDVGRLQTEMRDLASRLQLEEDAAADLRTSLQRLNADLASITGQRDDLQAELRQTAADRDQLGERLALAENQRRMLERDLQESRTQQQGSEQRVASLQQEMEEARRLVTADRTQVQTQLGELVQLRRDIEALRQVRADLESELETRTGELGVARDRASELQAELAGAEERTVLAQRELQDREIRLGELTQARDAAVNEQRAAVASVEALNRQIAQLGDQLRRLDAALGSKQQEIDQQSATIADLGQRLNLALASKVEELSQFRSDFFGRLRQVLGEREDIKVVGDRFVFQSEVLFESGTADLGERGRTELAKFATTFKPLMDELPDDLPWVLQVDGHTDRRPISTPRFPSNWELSTARAISVARYLVSEGIPSDRVAATGFAEFQPLDTGSSEDAYRRNRRIEIKLTTR
jgi:chemotaxis protein MotB